MQAGPIVWLRLFAGTLRAGERLTNITQQVSDTDGDAETDRGKRNNSQRGRGVERALRLQNGT